MIDISFPIRGAASIPADHGYLLFDAVCDVIPRMSHEPGWGLHPVWGREDGDRLQLGLTSAVCLRLPGSELGEALALTGRELHVGADRIRLGIGKVCPLKPSPRLRARAVTMPATGRGLFIFALQRELELLGAGDADVDVGEERWLRARVRTVVGYEVRVSGLAPGVSLELQARGVGARRHMGAGVFEAA